VRETRSETLRHSRKINTPEVRKTIKNGLQELFTSIELAHIEHPEEDFSDMIEGINGVITSYTAEVRTRNTLSKKTKGKIVKRELLLTIR
jgi:hypothetical protein